MGLRRRLFGLTGHLRSLHGPHAAPALASAEGGGGEQPPEERHRKDYAPPDFLNPTVQLSFKLGVGAEPTLVRGELACERIGPASAPLVLDGEELSLKSLSIDGVAVSAAHYTVTDETNASTTLTIAAAALPSSSTFTVTTEVEIFPEANKQGEGLYLSDSTFCTQCEPQGFRRITYHQDRPDVLAVYTVVVEGDAASCPVLLSNGNLIEEGGAGDGRHYTKWLDPFPKPSYLFALVAGDLGFLQVTGRLFSALPSS